MDETIKRLEARLKEAQEEIAKLKAEQKIVISDQNPGVFLAQGKIYNNPLLLIKVKGEKVYCVETVGNPTYATQDFFNAEYEIIKKLTSKDLTNMINEVK